VLGPWAGGGGGDVREGAMGVVVGLWWGCGGVVEVLWTPKSPAVREARKVDHEDVFIVHSKC